MVVMTTAGQPAKRTGVCAGENNECRVDYFTVNDKDEQSE